MLSKGVGITDPLGRRQTANAVKYQDAIANLDEDERESELVDTLGGVQKCQQLVRAVYTR